MSPLIHIILKLPIQRRALLLRIKKTPIRAPRAQVRNAPTSQLDPAALWQRRAKRPDPISRMQPPVIPSVHRSRILRILDGMDTQPHLIEQVAEHLRVS